MPKFPLPLPLSTPATQARTFQTPPIPNLQCSPLGVVSKKDGTWHIIMDLSSPDWSSTNDYISKKEFSLHYGTFDQALYLVARYGRDALVAKLDKEEGSSFAQYVWRTANYSAFTGSANTTLISASPLACDLLPNSSTVWLTPLSGHFFSFHLFS